MEEAALKDEDVCRYSKRDVCDALGISEFTLNNWYTWQNKRFRDQIVQEEYLPRPMKIEHMKGKPRRWSARMIEILREYQRGIVKGRNGIYGKYTNFYKWRRSSHG